MNQFNRFFTKKVGVKLREKNNFTGNYTVADYMPSSNCYKMFVEETSAEEIKEIIRGLKILGQDGMVYCLLPWSF